MPDDRFDAIYAKLSELPPKDKMPEGEWYRVRYMADNVAEAAAELDIPEWEVRRFIWTYMGYYPHESWGTFVPTPEWPAEAE